MATVLLLSACGGNTQPSDGQTASATPTSVTTVSAAPQVSSAAASSAAPGAITTPAGNGDAACRVIDVQFFANLTGATQVVPRERGEGVICRFEYFNEATKTGWIAQIEKMDDSSVFCEGTTTEYFAAGKHRGRAWTLTTADGKYTLVNGTICTKTLLLNFGVTNAPGWSVADMKTYLGNLAGRL